MFGDLKVRKISSSSSVSLSLCFLVFIHNDISGYLEGRVGQYTNEDCTGRSFKVSRKAKDDAKEGEARLFSWFKEISCCCLYEGEGKGNETPLSIMPSLYSAER